MAGWVALKSQAQLFLGQALQRLKSKPQFQAVMAGPPVAKTSHFALHLASLDAKCGEVLLFAQPVPWLGVLIPKRWAKRAVTRNTIRRQIYEVARMREAALPQAAMVVRLRSEFSRKQFISATSDALKGAVRTELQALFGKWVRPVVAAQPAALADAHG